MSNVSVDRELAHAGHELGSMEHVVGHVAGGASNVQDVYPLAPAQEGALFHHIVATSGDPYLRSTILRFDHRSRLDRYLRALQAVIDRHDILRTGVVWEGVPEPVQVVWRRAVLPIEEVTLDFVPHDRDSDEDNGAKQLYRRVDPRNKRLNLGHAPLMRAYVARARAGEGWLLLLLTHHLIVDNVTLTLLSSEIEAHMAGLADRLPPPIPFRHFVMQARRGVSRAEHESFFRRMLGDVQEPTAPFGLLEVHGDGSGIRQGRAALDASLASRLRAAARRLGVRTASLFHLAWAQVVARVSGRGDVVFGTILHGRRNAGDGAQRALGVFVKTLPVRLRIDASSVESSVRRTHELLSDLLHHEYASLALAQRCSGVAAPAPLFSSLLNYRRNREGDLAEAPRHWEGIEAVHGEERTNYPLIMMVDDLGEGFGLTAQVQTPIEPEPICGSMQTALAALVKALERSPGEAIQRLDVLPASERRRVLQEWNATETEYPRDACVHDLFEAHVQRAPDAVALVHGARSLRYAELNAQANRLAHRLRALGIGPEDRVALCMERSVAWIVGLLAVLKAGGAYVPLDPSYPSERLAYMLRDSAPKALLTSTGRVHDGIAGDVPVLELDLEDPEWAALSAENPERRHLGLTPEHLAYVIYTSGSTGLPKGVMVEHRGVCNLAHWHRHAFDIAPGARTSCVAGLGFDAAAWEIWSALGSGATLLLPDLPDAPSEDAARDPSALLAWWAEQELDTSFMPTPLAEVALSEQKTARGLRTLLVGGDRLRAPLDRAWPFALINNYGPTETSVVATSGRMEAHAPVVHIGRPIANTRIYILDGNGEPVPVGVTGELYIGGVGVARGYLHRPELTAERFVPDPFASEPGARMYRTGDLGRWLPDGNIEYVGRNDEQVKLRGFRIELGEIESRLAAHAGVHEAVVLVREDEPGERRLVAYYTGSEPVDLTALRAHMSSTLPDYMVPAAYMHMPSFPLTAHGKLNRRALPVPHAGAYAARGYAAPEGEVEAILAELWSELFARGARDTRAKYEKEAEHIKRESIGRYDNFFELGGHSLLAVTLIERMRHRGLSATVRTLFAAPTLSGLAAAVERGVSPAPVPPNAIPEDCRAIVPEMLPLVSLTAAEIEHVVHGIAGGASNVQDIYPLAPLQEGILFHHLLATDGDPYLSSSIYRFADRPRLESYLAALQAVMNRHDILRTSVEWEGVPEPVQVVWRQAALPIEEVVLERGPGDAAEQLYRTIDPRRQRLNLRRAPLMRAYVARAPDREGWLLLLLTHHLVGDNASSKLMLSEMGAHLAGETARWHAPVPFRDFVARARQGVARAEHEAFFRRLLADTTEPTAPYGLSDVRGDGSGITQASRTLEPELARRLRARARHLGVSAASIFHVAWALVLARATGRGDVVFGTVLLGRSAGHAGVERAMGLFINTLPVRIRIDATGAHASVQRAHALLADLLHHEHAPLALAQRCSGVAPPAPLVTSLLNYRHGLELPNAAPQSTGGSPLGWGGIALVHAEERTNYPLTLSVDDRGDDFVLTVQVRAPIEPERVGHAMHTAVSGLVEALERAPHQAIETLDVLPASERRRVLREWNATETAETAYVRERCIHEWFEAQAARTPDAVALTLVHGTESTTEVRYAELNARANRLAHHLRVLGVRPDDRVALCVERGLSMVVGLLAVLKAGGAYVPLDPSYPPERRAYMLRDCAPKVLLTQSGIGRGEGMDDMGDATVPVLDLDAPEPVWSGFPASNPDPRDVGLTSRHLAYVIYTSGSTGLPKGVMTEHANVTRLFAVNSEWFRFDGKDVWALFHSISFDFSVWELWGALLHGGRLVVVPAAIARSANDFYRLVCHEGVTVLNQTPGAFRHFVAAQAASAAGGGLPTSASSATPHRLHTIILGGEALDAATLEAWYARNGAGDVRIVNGYGPTETTVWATWYTCRETDAAHPPIGRPIWDTRVYILNEDGQPAPVGAVGELYIGGAGVARGYLHRPELTTERFQKDPFAGEPGARMYRTGDLGRWLPDGNIEYWGRNDHQVKIRGFRVELGEIESRLAAYPGVREAVVVVREDAPGEKRLVGYYTAAEALPVGELRAHLSSALPDYMVPAAYVHMFVLPLTANGKLDRRGLPAPDADDYMARGYVPPQGEVESTLAELWAELLQRERVGRHDNFFELGGHSLMAVTLMEKMRRRSLHAHVRTLFATPTLSDLAAAVVREAPLHAVPPNAIPNDGTAITPAMLPLVALTEAEIETIVARVPGGAANVQDIYPLAPLQEGILFHHLLATEGDPYLISTIFRFADRARLERYLAALQAVMDRHDILRTALAWEGVSEPVQVVWRRATLPVHELTLSREARADRAAHEDCAERADREGADAAEQLYAHIDPRHRRLDLHEAPLMRAYVARDTSGDGWLLLLLTHHLVLDHSTLDAMHDEVLAHLTGETHRLPPPVPFRNFVAQARLGVGRAEHEAFFRRLLGDVDAPTAPFGALELRADGAGISQARRELDSDLAERLRGAARRLGVSAASIFHLAWAQVLARVSGRNDVVFGTVLLGRMLGGSGVERAMGLFINTLPVRIRIDDTDAESSVRRAHGLLADLLHHEHASLALAQRCSGVAAPAPLFASLLNYRHSPDDASVKGRSFWNGIELVHAEERTHYPLTLSVDDLVRGFSMTAQVQAPASPEQVCSSMQTAITRLVEALERSPQTAIAALDVLPATERHRVLQEWNATEIDFPRDACVHELFEAQVARTPDAVALVQGPTVLHYAELNARANRLAHHLRGLGVGPDDRVALCLDRSVAMVVGLFAVLKAGGAYVPLDPSYPRERLASMVRDAAPNVILTQSGTALALARAIAGGVAVLDLDTPEPAWSALPPDNLERDAIGLTSEALAYVIHTSGSTGVPKGVMNEHRAVVNRLLWMQREYQLCERDAVLQKTPFSFDVSVWEFFWPLLAGAKLVLARPEGHKDGAYLAEILRHEAITTVHFVPSMLHAFLEQPDAAQCRALTRVICSGEALPASLVERFFAQLPAARLYNLYGPTEAAVDVTAWECTAGATVSDIPIGRPISNARIYILDERRQPVPTGVPGELYIGGIPVARGYLHRPELTAERFVEDPFAREPGSRMYRTGDLGRWLEDGTIAYLGRNDDQVKIRGFRIELGEIEARLRAYPGAREAVVLAREDEPGEKRLVAYYTGSEPLDTVGLRAHLASALPDYMVPAAYVHMPALPVTPNGKLDRSALPAPGAGAYTARQYAAPRGEVESILAELWGELLSRERVGRHDNFFELGGHSLKAVALMEKMRRRGLRATVRTLFAAPTLSELAAATERAAPQAEAPQADIPPNAIPEDCDAIAPEMLPLVTLSAREIAQIVGRVAGGASNVQDIYPLAPLQEGILFHHLLATHGDPYLSSSIFRLPDRARLESHLEAIQHVIDRHDILRTAVEWEGVSEPVQVVWRRALLPVEEVALDPEAGDAAEQLYARVDPRRLRLDVRRAPLMRVHVARDIGGAGRDGWLLLLLMHHLVGDNTTSRAMVSEMELHGSGQLSRLPPPVPFRAFVARARLGTRRAEHEAFFQRLLGDVTEPTAPFGLLEVRGDGSGMVQGHRPVAPELARRLRERARRLGVSAASLVHVAWAQVLARVTGRDDVVFGTVLLGRMVGGAGVERAMGLFVNTLPVRIRIDATGVADSVRRVHASLADLLHHEHASLALAQRCSGVPAPAPLFSSLLNYRHDSSEANHSSPHHSSPQTVIETVRVDERTNYPLTVSVDDLGEAFALTAQVQAPIDPERLCDTLLTALAGLVDALERAPETAIRTLDVLPASERHRIVHAWNAVATEPSPSACIHELFEAQVARTPDAVALVHGSQTLKYAELNAHANRLARHLRHLGVRPDDRVALCLPRGASMVIALLAVLKAGGAYVPLDPAYPSERLAYMLRDSAPKVLLTQTGLAPADLGDDVAVLNLDAEEPAWSARSADDLARGERGEVELTPAHLAYVIYTSGSTGLPKGVMVEHAQVVRLFEATSAWFQFDANDVWTLFHSIAFDFSVWELWGALLHGGRLIVVSPETARSPDEFYRLVCREGVTILNQTPSAFRHVMAAQAASADRHRLRTVIFGGEALEPAMLAPWYARNDDEQPRLVNMYGITETTVHVTYRPLQRADVARAGASPIGERIPDLRIYILDRHGEPAPVGVAGELFIGGAGVARGYLNRPQLTAERFVKDPFAGGPGARMYRSGDLGRWLPDGSIEYLGRNDDQIKIRGFRIELGEIEARLQSYPGVREAAVVAREDEPGEKRLVGYYTSAEPAVVESVRAYLAARLPDYMVPAAYVHLPALPLTAHGKLDRRALPAPDAGAYTAHEYSAPRGEVESILAELWAELLQRDRVGRHDNFFELGGHSLKAVTLMERMRRRGLHAPVRAIFAAPTLSGLAAATGREVSALAIPPNAIPEDCKTIMPDMLPLAALTEREIEHVVGRVAGGASNVQDIYPLAPLQEGILFHHLLATEGDPYVISTLFRFPHRARLEAHLDAMQAVMNRHDILRTAVEWEGVSEPVQVVWRRAMLPVEEVALDPQSGDAAEQLRRRIDPRRQKLDVRRAPLMRAYVARDTRGEGWLLLLLTHHLAIDHSTLEVMHEEVTAHLAGATQRLSPPVPFRNFVAQARLGVSRAEHEAFFHRHLRGVTEPTAPYGLVEVRGDGRGIAQAHRPLDPDLARRLRDRARRLGVSAASIFHLAWARVLARATGRGDVVFGTILLGRMLGGDGVERAMGLFINTLPVRIRIDATEVVASVQKVHGLLADLLHHEHASLALAQRCSGVASPAPLFSSLLNYRHSPEILETSGRVWNDIEIVHVEERTNYPLTLSVDDGGEAFALTVQVQAPIEPDRVCEAVHTAVSALVDALERAPQTRVEALDVLPASERHHVLHALNATQTDHPRDVRIHDAIEWHAAQTPDTLAVVQGPLESTYAELNARANRLAHYLRRLGVRPDDRVALCVERGIAMVAALLAVLKAGAAYVPLDPSYPSERLVYMLLDSNPKVLLTQAGTALHDYPHETRLRVLDLDAAESMASELPSHDPAQSEVRLTAGHLAYIIYTSGSTGRPKGVMVEHRGVCNLVHWHRRAFGVAPGYRASCVAGLGFDAAAWEIWSALGSGATLVLPPEEAEHNPHALLAWWADQKLDIGFLPTPLAEVALSERTIPKGLRTLLVGGDRLRARPDGALPFELVNNYGPTETSVVATSGPVESSAAPVHIGRPIANTRVYILDEDGEPAPVGVAGELYVGGAGVARGYWRLPGLTAERFVEDPFAGEPDARMYRTGDVGRWLPSGNIEYLGRNDDQVKIRGVRIELGEIEAQLASCSVVREAVVAVREDEAGEKRLIGYYTAAAPVAVEKLRAHLASALPDSMVPAAYVHLPALPLTPHGKWDRRALPAPDRDAYVARGYSAPRGEVETILAELWSELLQRDQVGRHDNFFELGGHSLLAVTLMERMRRRGLRATVRTLFAAPTLSELAAAIGREGASASNPTFDNDSAHGADLLRLTAAEIEHVMGRVPGGVANVQDIYPLAPLQEGILFHHLLASDSDPYVLSSVFRFADRARLERYLEGMQAVMDRHDILRTAVEWEGVSEPVQVVWRKVALPVEEIALDPEAGDPVKELYRRVDPRRQRLELRRAPLMRTYIARQGAGEAWLLLLLTHHLAMDHGTVAVMHEEVTAHLAGETARLPEPVPFRRFVAQSRFAVGRAEHEAFFQRLLGDVAEPTAPFGLSEVRGDGDAISQARRTLEPELASRLRERARRLGVSAASIFHLAWAQVLARVSGRDDVVFGTVLLGRMRGGDGVERAMGLFINTLPVRIRIDATGVEARVQRVHELLADLLHHEHASLALAQRCSGVAAPAPLFSSLLNYRHSSDAFDAGRPAWNGIELVYAEERTNYPLTMSVDDMGRGFALTAQVQSPIEPEPICDAMHTAVSVLVEALERAPQRAIEALDVLPPAERHRVLHAWNAIDLEPPRDRCIHELFEAQVARTPEAVALVHQGATLTYAELNARANRLAHHLRDLGVRPDDRVALCVERSIAMVVGLLAVLKAGAAYVPLDPSYPAERLAYMLRDSAPEVLLTQTGMALGALAREATMPVLDLDAPDPAWSGLSSRDLKREDMNLTPEHLAYVIYTSGSTGLPKGVMVEHANVTRLFSATSAWFEFGAHDVWTLFHSIAFDFSVWELWGALLHGGRLVVVPHDVARSPDEFYRLVCREGVTILNQTPSAFRHFMAAQAAHPTAHRLRTIVFGGEALDVAALEPWHARNPGELPRLVNMYGITETSVHATYRPLVRAEVARAGSSPIGRRIPDLRIYILDRHGRPVPVGVAGELYIGGAGVARGYLHRPELTAERFVRDPFVHGPGSGSSRSSRLYRSGDLGRWLPDGSIEYLGRNDDQVKIRGFRIELGEIEARLGSCPGVREAAVLVREDEPGEKRLVGYYAAAEPVAVENLRAHLSSVLPDYMVPAAYVYLETLPLTAHGKLDRLALPAPDDDAYTARGYEAPRGEVETILAGLWSELLQRERVGRRDNFFELGGHSLLAVTLMERMRRRGLQATVRTVFATPALCDLAAAVKHDAAPAAIPENTIPEDCNVITPDMLPLVALTAREIAHVVARVAGGVPNVQDIYPLAPLQEGILFHHLLATEGDPYIVSSIFRFADRARLEGYLGAIQAVMARHDILRTAVEWEGVPEPVQVVWRRAELPVEEVTLEPAVGDGAGDAAKQLYERIDPRRQRFDLRRAPLMRASIARDGAGEGWLLLLLTHHLVVDHSTLDVMHEEVTAHLSGDMARLPPPVPFRQFVAQARLAVSRGEHEAFFQRLLGDIEEPTAPYGLLEVRGDGSGISQAQRTLSPELAQRLRARAKRLGVSAASIFHLAWAQVLARVSDRREVVFGTVLLGRMLGGDGVERAMGLFINTLPVRIGIDASGAEAKVRKVHELLADLLHHEHASLALAQRCSGVAAPAPLFSSLLNYRHSPEALEASRRIWNGIEVVHAEERTNYPLTLSVDDMGKGFTLTVQVQTPIAPNPICEAMHTAVAGLVEALERSPGTSIETLDVLPASERHRLLHAWNATEADYPRDASVHELFEAQVARTPDRVALVHGSSALRYSELDARANRLAHRLRALGVGADDRVAVCAERSVAMVVALLAVLKAGGAYVPLDPSYPPERLSYMLRDSAPKVLLTAAGMPLDDRDGIAAGIPAVLRLDAAEPLDAGFSSENPERLDIQRAPEHLAYVIYTSGSTGVPKGVMNEHRAVVNRLVWMQRAYGLAEHDAVLQKTPFSFDVSVWEFFWPLLTGARMVLARADGHKDSAYLAEVIRHERITTVHFVPSMLHAFLEQPQAARCRSLTRVICSGEALPASLVRRFYEQLPNARLYNLYGPTEAAVDVTAWECPSDGSISEMSTIPIGRPIANARIYILNGRGEPSPVGVAGELYIGGVAVARGYLHRPELTAERFVRDPFAVDPEARMYRTGDLARWLPDGDIEYLGRNDHQVKIRGFRIELGEIESRLASYPEVREAAVLAREDAPGEKRLVAYYTAAEPVAVEDLRAHLSSALPEYMVPAAYMYLATMPLSPNGKLDCRALPAPDSGAYTARGYEPPQGELESLLAELWSELLQRDRIGRHDDFFELGGHSLSILRVINSLRQGGLSITASDVFDHPTIARLAESIARAPQGPSEGSIAIRAHGAEPPLFVVHEGAGSLFYAHHLARFIDEDVPVYGMLPVSKGDRRVLAIHDMAEQMIRILRELRPSGPYRLAGYSFGGLIAYEIASQLIDLGHEVEFVGLLDTYRSVHRSASPAIQAPDEQDYFSILLHDLLSVGEEHYSPEQMSELESLARNADFEGLVAIAKRWSLMPPELADLSWVEVKAIIQQLHENAEAAGSYHPKCISAPVHFYRAEDSANGIDPIADWARIGLPNLHVTRVPGSHRSMMSRRNIHLLAEAMNASLKHRPGQV
ncbi:non-ribosomal peptide synthase/polyketide synthase [Pendulispora albinea]|uniref:Non-ribosomal peptide synthase/polyketide synthase n=1 Tax=Pendulispora albinea TaxID=2741071 RepID=A0ABZ2LUZ5_9BACT